MIVVRVVYLKSFFILFSVERHKGKEDKEEGGEEKGMSSSSIIIIVVIVCIVVAVIVAVILFKRKTKKESTCSPDAGSASLSLVDRTTASYSST